MCIACRLASGYSQPDEIADFFFTTNRLQVQAAKYEKLPVDRLPPPMRLKEITQNDESTSLQGFYHPRCPFYDSDARVHENCLEENISSIPDLFIHLERFHTTVPLDCARCRQNFETARERDTHMKTCKELRSYSPLSEKVKGTCLDSIALVRCMDMRLAQHGKDEATRLAGISFELMRNTENARENIQVLGEALLKLSNQLIEGEAGDRESPLDDTRQDFGYYLLWNQVQDGDNEDVEENGDEYAENGDEHAEYEDEYDENGADVDEFGHHVECHDLESPYLWTGVGLRMSVFHDLWKLYYGTNMPQAVAGKLLGLIRIHFER